MQRLQLYLGSLLVFFTSLAIASNNLTDDRRNTASEPDSPREGFSFTLTPKLFYNILDKAADKLAGELGADEDQKYRTREIVRQRLGTWLADHQEDVQKLLSGYFEDLLATDAPSPEEVAEWAAQLRPLTQDFQNTVVEMSHEINDYLTEDQQNGLEIAVTTFKTAFTLIDQRLAHWEQGGFDPVTDHPTGAGYDQAEQKRSRQASEAIHEAREATLQEIYEKRTNPFGNNLKRIRDNQLPNQPANAKPQVDQDPWITYVREFKKKYELTPEQTNQCDRILHALQEERDNYLRRVDPRIVEIETRLTETPEGPARNQLIAKYEELARPIETKFTLLKQKLNKIPTRAQRLKARAKVENNKQPAAAEATN